ncbi:hypothetical protein SLEP1_g57355 [Rubroshorea leprosula]|uniref:Uncharacterized protein n=1 Tax=Rubroshorea leprosula TaxID=152421 RepID=A0AAV5MNG6_9ROSI|nr:hypothetical protein SLEP1_g57355 [Rubroshorea leprosula]
MGFDLIHQLQDVAKNGVLVVQTLRNNIMASTVLASTAIMLSSLIVILMSSGNGNRLGLGWFDYRDRSERAFSIKFFSILVCFLVTFLLNVQSIRYYSVSQHPHQHAIQEDIASPAPPAAEGRLRGDDDEQGKLFLVIGPVGFLLLFASFFVDLWSHFNYP